MPTLLNGWQVPPAHGVLQPEQVVTTVHCDIVTALTESVTARFLHTVPTDQQKLHDVQILHVSMDLTWATIPGTQSLGRSRRVGRACREATLMGECTTKFSSTPFPGCLHVLRSIEFQRLLSPQRPGKSYELSLPLCPAPQCSTWLLSGSPQHSAYYDFSAAIRHSSCRYVFCETAYTYVCPVAKELNGCTAPLCVVARQFVSWASVSWAI